MAINPADWITQYFGVNIYVVINQDNLIFYRKCSKNFIILTPICRTAALPYDYFWLPNAVVKFLHLFM